MYSGHNDPSSWAEYLQSPALYIFIIDLSDTSELIEIYSTLSVYLRSLHMLFGPVNNYVISSNSRMKIPYLFPLFYRKNYKIISDWTNFFYQHFPSIPYISKILWFSYYLHCVTSFLLACVSFHSHIIFLYFKPFAHDCV
jgi:hypothetical protein